jgi:hypothetical protein
MLPRADPREWTPMSARRGPSIVKGFGWGLLVIASLASGGCSGGLSADSVKVHPAPPPESPVTTTSLPAVSQWISTLGPEQIAADQAIARASLINAEQLGADWTLYSDTSGPQTTPPPVACDQFSSTIFDRALDVLLAGVTFTAPGKRSVQLFVTVYPTAAIAERYFEEFVKPDFEPCLLAYIDATVVLEPSTSTTEILTSSLTNASGDRRVSYQTLSTITQSPALNNEPTALISILPFAYDWNFIQVGRAIVEVDMSSDGSPTADPAGIIDRTVTLAVATAKMALEPTTQNS